MRSIKCDILDIQVGILCHQVNCMGVMGAGLARQIKIMYPLVYKEYRKAYLEEKLELGYVLFTTVRPNLHIANICGQFKYGRDRVHTSIDALKEGLTTVSLFQDEARLPVYIPFKMGCGLGGGDWNEVSKVIESIIPGAFIVSL